MAEVCFPQQDADLCFHQKLLRTGDISASGATFEMQMFDHNSWSFLRVVVPLLLPPTTSLTVFLLFEKSVYT